MDDAYAILRDMAMAKTNTLTTFAAHVMKSYLLFGGAFTKAQLVPIFISPLPENLRGVVHQKLSNTPEIADDKIARHAEVPHKMTNSTASTSTSMATNTSRTLTPTSIFPLLAVVPTKLLSLGDFELNLPFLYVRITQSQADATRRVGRSLTRVYSGD